VILKRYVKRKGQAAAAGWTAGEEGHCIAPTPRPCYNAFMTAETPKKRRWLPRFSLRTLLLLVLLVGSGVGLRWRWAPWEIFHQFEAPIDRTEGGFVFSRQGNLIALKQSNSKILIWDLKLGRLLHSLALGSDFRQVSVAFSNNGRRILTVAYETFGESTATIWEARTGKKSSVLKAENGEVFDFSLSPSGDHILSKVALENKSTIKLWSTTSGRCVATCNVDFYSAPSYSPKENRIIASLDSGIGVWHLKGDKLKVIQTNTRFKFAKFSPDGTRILAIADSLAKLLDSATGRVIIELKHSSSIRFAQFSKDGTRIVTMDSNNPDIARVWDSQLGKCICAVEGLGNPFGSPYSRFSPDATRYVVSSPLLQVREAATGRTLSTLKSVGDPINPYSIHSEFSPRDFLINVDNGMAELWHRRRPEWWYGIAWLPESWLTLIFGIALLWSLRRDWKRFGTPKKSIEPSIHNG